jgi:hypothetical protein
MIAALAAVLDLAEQAEFSSTPPALAHDLHLPVRRRSRNNQAGARLRAYQANRITRRLLRHRRLYLKHRPEGQVKGVVRLVHYLPSRFANGILYPDFLSR